GDVRRLGRGRLAARVEARREVDNAVEAGTVAEPRRLMPESKPDVVVVDMRLPDGDGLDVLRAAKQLEPPPTVVVLTNYAYVQLRSTCLEAGADEFLDQRNQFDRLPAIVTKLRRPAP